MALAGEDKRKQKAEGLAIAKSLLDTACELFNGIYLITPFLRSDLTSELATYIKQKKSGLMYICIDAEEAA